MFENSYVLSYHKGQAPVNFTAENSLFQCKFLQWEAYMYDTEDRAELFSRLRKADLCANFSTFCGFAMAAENSLRNFLRQC